MILKRGTPNLQKKGKGKKRIQYHIANPCWGEKKGRGGNCLVASDRKKEKNKASGSCLGRGGGWASLTDSKEKEKEGALSGNGRRT